MSYCAKIPEENQAAALLHYLGISRTRKGYWYIRWILEWGQQEEPVQGPPPSDGEGYVPRAAPGGHPAELPGGGRIRPGRGVGAAVRSLPVAEPLRGRAAGGGHGRHGLASAGAGGAARKIAPFPPAFLGVYWGKGGKLRCLIFGWIPFWRCAATGTTRGRRRS